MTLPDLTTVSWLSGAPQPFFIHKAYKKKVRSLLKLLFPFSGGVDTLPAHIVCWGRGQIRRGKFYKPFNLFIHAHGQCFGSGSALIRLSWIEIQGKEIDQN
jgi:hypothetical protein